MTSYGVFGPDVDGGDLQIEDPEDMSSSNGASKRASNALERANEYALKLAGPIQRPEFVARVLGRDRRRLYTVYVNDPLGDASQLVLGSPVRFSQQG